MHKRIKEQIAKKLTPIAYVKNYPLVEPDSRVIAFSVLHDLEIGLEELTDTVKEASLVPVAYRAVRNGKAVEINSSCLYGGYDEKLKMRVAYPCSQRAIESGIKKLLSLLGISVSGDYIKRGVLAYTKGRLQSGVEKSLANFYGMELESLQAKYGDSEIPLYDEGNNLFNRFLINLAIRKGYPLKNNYLLMIFNDVLLRFGYGIRSKDVKKIAEFLREEYAITLKQISCGGFNLGVSDNAFDRLEMRIHSPFPGGSLESISSCMLELMDSSEVDKIEGITFSDSEDEKESESYLDGEIRKMNAEVTKKDNENPCRVMDAVKKVALRYFLKHGSKVLKELTLWYCPELLFNDALTN